MCWSANASLSSFIIGWCLSIVLIIRNKPMDRIWGISFMFVTTMQLWEFLIWLDQPEKGSTDCKSGKYKGNLNNISSQIASIQNFLQPVMGGVLALLFLPSDKLLYSPIILGIIIAVYFTAIIIWIFQQKLYKKRLCTIPCGETGCNNHHLQWQWTRDNFAGKYIWYGYFISLLLVLIVFSKTKGGLYGTLFLVITCAMASFIYPFKKAVGSWWCVAAVAGPLLKLVIPSENLLQNVV